METSSVAIDVRMVNPGAALRNPKRRKEATDSLCRAAGALAEKYGLRGFDSIHLASFAEVVSRAGIGDTRFSSFDERLNQAAKKLTRTLERTRQK
jgi:hypothetical protein